MLGRQKRFAGHCPRSTSLENRLLRRVLVAVQCQYPRLWQQRPREAEQQEEGEVRAEWQMQHSNGERALKTQGIADGCTDVAKISKICAYTGNWLFLPRGLGRYRVAPRRVWRPTQAAEGPISRAFEEYVVVDQDGCGGIGAGRRVVPGFGMVDDAVHNTFFLEGA
jgi:hypothetical protein